ncbi:serine hydrolase [uncultured Nevskia sp.]|uniref:serine hydrolase domain-containing protein n=1 Tax=uncultured Nevskia sp. TaxID=228950 RepID=UPI0025E4E95D|nr:serine hydrolase domain-containing protein [uncultured Nevskia sp.]
MVLFQPMKVQIARDLHPITTIADDVEAAGPRGGLSAADTKAIWAALKSLYRSGAYPGIAFCLRRHGELVFNRSIGHAEGNGPADSAAVPKRLLTPETPICLFSASKAVTAVLLHKLAEDGGIRLEERVSHYLPAFAQAGKRDTTISDVLAHRGGFPTMKIAKIERKVELMEDWDRIIRLICAAPPTSGKQMSYHAITGGFILAEVLQKVTGTSLSSYLDQHIRKPLKMKHFTYGIGKKYWPEVAINYEAGALVRFPISTVAERALFVPFPEVVRASNTDSFKQAVIPAGNIFATADETSRFFQMLLDGGVANGQQLLKAETVARIARPLGRMNFDRTLMIPMRYSEGMMLGAKPAGMYGPDTADAFGHLGFMNILGWADPRRHISAGLLTTGKAILGTHLLSLSRLLATISSRCA